MVRFTVLITALVSVLAVGAASAQATAGDFDVSGSPSAIRFGSSGSAFTVLEGLKIKCGTSEWLGKSTAESTPQLTLTPLIEECKLGGFPEPLRMNGCKFELTGGAKLTATVSIVECTAGKQIELELYFCTLTFPEQPNLSHIVFENRNPGEGKEDEASTKTLIAKVTLSGLKYKESSGVFCPSPGKEHTDGALASEMTVKAFLLSQEEKATDPYGHEYLRPTGATPAGIQMT